MISNIILTPVARTTLRSSFLPPVGPWAAIKPLLPRRARHAASPSLRPPACKCHHVRTSRLCPASKDLTLGKGPPIHCIHVMLWQPSLTQQPGRCSYLSKPSTFLTCEAHEARLISEALSPCCRLPTIQATPAGGRRRLVQACPQSCLILEDERPQPLGDCHLGQAGADLKSGTQVAGSANMRLTSSTQGRFTCHWL